MEVLSVNFMATDEQCEKLKSLFDAASIDHCDHLDDEKEGRGMVFGQVHNDGLMRFAYAPYPYSKKLINIVEGMKKA